MLDLTKVAAQVEGMLATLKSGRDERQKRLQSALDVFSCPSTDVEKLRRKIEMSKTTWLVARLVDGLSQRYPAPPIPAEFNVIASDGSHIDVDRHRSTRCFLINTGSVVLSYGDKPDASLDSFPQLYATDEELVIAPPDGSGREQQIEGPLLGIKRGVEECRHLAELASKMPPGSSTLALLDGTLILWGLESNNYPDFVKEALLTNGLLACLDDMKKLNNDRRLAIASYISFPRSTDVVNTLRVSLCPHEPADCDRYCPTNESRACDAVATILDRELFSNSLSEGERSALFISPSKVQKQYKDHIVYFFYLKVDDEIARVEVPEWVAMNGSLLNLTHALLLDQCRRGQGYPVALSEAHEKAVVTGADREQFWELVDSSLVEQHMSTLCSAKSRSKITRWI
ncbi:MAG: DNA double-strand break repair nuclease NurA [Chloroflexi bacterium]|nr:DNA double-strand break repair nuclease NurA [Chloroflexota bacterium]